MSVWVPPDWPRGRPGHRDPGTEPQVAVSGDDDDAVVDADDGADSGDGLGGVRRIDSGTTPDRHPRTVGARPSYGERHADYGERHADYGERRPVYGERRPAYGERRPAYGERRPLLVDEPVPRSAREGRGRGQDNGGGRSRRRRRDGVEANARLTGSTAAVLLVLLAAEGVTILSIRPLLSAHVFIGMLLLPPVLLKIGSTTWRFARYYLGDPEYRRKGAPPPLLRLLGPIVVVLTVTVLATGIALLLAPLSMRSTLLLLHKGSFVVWLIVMAVHVLGHLLDTARLAPRDWYHRTRRQVKGAGARQWLVASSIAVGLVLGAVMLPHVGTWLTAFGHG